VLPDKQNLISKLPDKQNLISAAGPALISKHRIPHKHASRKR
jgi:hypothetical protein